MEVLSTNEGGVDVDDVGDASRKRARTSQDAAKEKPSSVITLFTAQDGSRTGPPIDLPMSSTPKQLEALVNTLLENEDHVRKNALIHY